MLAVIGDDQSLAQDLSTFSSPVRQVRVICRRGAGPAVSSTARRGPDLTEGAALGAPRGAPGCGTVTVTTHRAAEGVCPGGAAPRTVAFDAERANACSSMVTRAEPALTTAPGFRR
jgi:hypothetical protein